MRRPSEPAFQRFPDGEPVRGPASEPSTAQDHPRAAVVGGDPELAAALERCAARDSSGLEALRAWQGGRLRETLLRTLGEPALADRVLEEVVADLWDNAALHQTLGRGPAEDHVFAVLRRHAHARLREQPPPQPREPVPPPVPAAAPREPAPVRPWPRPVAAPPAAPPEEPVAPAPAPLAPEPAPAPPEPVAPTLASPPTETDFPPAARRLRRPDAFGPFEPVRAEPLVERRAGRGWSRWLLLLLAWVVAAGAGFGLAFVAFQLSAHRDAASLWQSGDTVLPAPTAAPPPAAAPESLPSRPSPGPAVRKPATTADVGAPLAAPEPPVVALRPLELEEEPATRAVTVPRAAERSLAIAPALPPAPVPQPRPVVEAALPAQSRIFVHFTEGDAGSMARAQALEGSLERRGAGSVQLVPVRFPIGTPSVRYFYPEDRLPAQRLLQGARVELSAEGRPAPSEPTDFTRFRPSPRPGTIEVWLPGG
jgi:hypothetical protein